VAGRAFREQFGDDRQRLRGNDRAARSLAEPGRDQHQRRRGEPGGERGDAEGHESDQRHPAMPGPVAVSIDNFIPSFGGNLGRNSTRVKPRQPHSTVDWDYPAGP
jgi:hypothetical protein